MKPILILRRSAALVAAGLLALAPSLHAGVTLHGTTVSLYPAEWVLGSRVISSGGHKVGEISDFVFDFHGQPRLTDVIVADGFFGRSRAVPVQAIRQQGDTFRIALSRQAFDAIAPLPVNVTSYFARRADVVHLDHAYHLRARLPGGRYVTYSSLYQSEVFGKGGTDIGFVTDALINLNQHRALYLAVHPTNLFFGNINSTRLEIPAYDVTSSRGDEVALNVSFDRLDDAPYVSQLGNLTSSSLTPFGHVFRLNIG